MANSFVDSLPAIDPASLYYADIYVATSNTSYKIPWKHFLGWADKNQDTVLVLSGQTTTAGTSTFNTVLFDVVSADPRGWYNAASKGLIQVDYDGTMRVTFSLKVNSDAQDGCYYTLFKNGSTFFGGTAYVAEHITGNLGPCNGSHVFTVTSGDYLELKYSNLNTPTFVNTPEPSYIWFQPVSEWS